MAELRLSSERRDDSLVVTIGGELDIVTSRQLDEYLTRSRREHRRIVLVLRQAAWQHATKMQQMAKRLAQNCLLVDFDLQFVEQLHI